MWPAVVVIFHELANAFTKFGSVISRIQVDILLLNGTPEALYPYIVLASVSAIHTDFDMI